MTRRLCIGILAICALSPLVSLLPHPGAFLADPASELPVKLWAFETFGKAGLFGRVVPEIGFPGTGPLNNADIVGTIWGVVVRPLFGRVVAWDTLIPLQLFAAMLAGWALAREVVEDEVSALVGGVAFALTPLVLVYCVAGAVSDMLNLWPYPLAVRHLIRAARGRSPGRNGAWAGLFVAIGFVTCPYDVVVFASMLVPGAFVLPRIWREAGSDARTRLVRTAGAAAVVTAVVAGGYAVWLQAILDDPTSRMSASFIADTRHSAPWPFLEPGYEARYVAYLSDYVAVGKGALIERSAGSRYYRAFSPGLVVLALATVGAIAKGPRRRAAREWLGVAAFCAIASTGPFLPVTRDLHFPTAVNPAFLLLHYAMPGARLLLEPFRYAIPAALALAMAAAIGTRAVAERLRRPIGFVVPFAFLAELVVLSPVPVPLPTARVDVPDVYAKLHDLLPPGAIIELPWFDRGTERFNRDHFLHQLVHGRPIPDEVFGFPPRYLCDNQFTAALLHLERPSGPLAVNAWTPARIEPDREKLAARGFAGVVLSVDAYDDPVKAAMARAMLAPFGAPVYDDGSRVVYRIR